MQNDLSGMFERKRIELEEGKKIVEEDRQLKMTYDKEKKIKKKQD